MGCRVQTGLLYSNQQWANLFNNNCTCVVSKCKSSKSKWYKCKKSKVQTQGPNGAGCGVYMGQVQTWQGVGPNGVGSKQAGSKWSWDWIYLIFTQKLLLPELPIITGITTITIITAITQLLKSFQNLLLIPYSFTSRFHIKPLCCEFTHAK